VRGLVTFGWNKWREICAFAGLKVPDRELIAAGRAILREIVRLSNAPHRHATARACVQEAETSATDPETDRGLFETPCFQDRHFKRRLQSRWSMYLKRIESIAILSQFSEQDSSALPLPRNAASPPSDWWSEDHDRLLVAASLKWGLGVYEHFVEDANEKVLSVFGEEGNYLEHSDLTARFIKLAETAKRNATTTTARKPSEVPKAPKAQLRGSVGETEWTQREKTQLVQYLLRRGIDQTPDGRDDFNAVAVASGLSDVHTGAQIEQFLKSISTGGDGDSEESVVTSRTASRLAHVIGALRDLRVVIKGPDVLKGAIRQRPWPKVPAPPWTVDLEFEFFKELAERGIGEAEDILEKPLFAVFDDGPPTELTRESSVVKRIQALAQFIVKQKQAPREPPKLPLTSYAAAMRPPPLQFDPARFIYPFSIGQCVTVWNMGRVNPSGAFHTERYIFPIGFKILRPFRAISNPAKEEPWFAEIAAENGRPVFQIWPASQPHRTFKGYSMAEPFGLAATAMGVTLPINGVSMWMFDQLNVQFAIQRLPRADQCKGYMARKIVKDPTTGMLRLEQAVQLGGTPTAPEARAEPAAPAPPEEADVPKQQPTEPGAADGGPQPAPPETGAAVEVPGTEIPDAGAAIEVPTEVREIVEPKEATESEAAAVEKEVEEEPKKRPSRRPKPARHATVIGPIQSALPQTKDGGNTGK
jgi:hypothetical protein